MDTTSSTSSTSLLRLSEEAVAAAKAAAAMVTMLGLMADAWRDAHGVARCASRQLDGSASREASSKGA